MNIWTGGLHQNEYNVKKSIARQNISKIKVTEFVYIYKHFATKIRHGIFFLYFFCSTALCAQAENDQ